MPRDGLVQTKNIHGIGTEVRSTNLRFSMITTTPTNTVGATGSMVQKSEPGNCRWCEGIKDIMAFHSSRIVATHYQKFTLQITMSVRARVNHRSRDVLERALIFLLFRRRRRDLFFFHFSRILRAEIKDCGERA